MIGTIGPRLSAWWAACKFVVILAAALAASLYANYRQWRHAIEAPLRAENRALESWIQRSTKIANERQAEAAALFKRLEVIDEWTSRGVRVYHQAAKASPLPSNCVPGQARADAVNAILGPQGPSTPGEQQQ